RDRREARPAGTCRDGDPVRGRARLLLARRVGKGDRVQGPGLSRVGGLGPQATRFETRRGRVILYFFERISEDDFIGPVIVAAGDEQEAWLVLARREG